MSALLHPVALPLGGALGKSDLVKRANRMAVDKKRSQPQIKNGDILLTYIGLLCQGKTSFDSVREFHADPDYFKAALGIAYEIPSAETLRQRMDAIGSSLRKDILQANVTMFKGEVSIAIINLYGGYFMFPLFPCSYRSSRRGIAPSAPHRIPDLRLSRIRLFTRLID